MEINWLLGNEIMTNMDQNFMCFLRKYNLMASCCYLNKTAKIIQDIELNTQWLLNKGSDLIEISQKWAWSIQKPFPW